MAALDDSPALLERARSMAELGAALRRDGQRAAARDPLARALDLAARCGARPLAGRAREELRAAGARPRRHHWSSYQSPAKHRITLRIGQISVLIGPTSQYEWPKSVLASCAVVRIQSIQYT